MSAPGAYVSHWMEEALADEPHLRKERDSLPSSADVVIAGGGFTGLWTAIRLLEQDPALEVCVLEAQYCGYGASGRNGGIAEASWAKFPTMYRLYGATEAVRLARAIEAGLGELRAFCELHRIDAQLRHRGNLWVATNPSQVGSWDTAVDCVARNTGSPFRPIDPAQSRRLSGSELAYGGVFEADAASLQPARLVRALRRVALGLGARVHEHTAMTGYDGGGPVRVRTPRGTIRASKLVLATNSWLAADRRFRPYLFVTSSDIVATEPVPALRDSAEQQDSLGGGICLSDSRRLILYWRSTPDGRIVFGKGGGAMSRGNRVDGRFTGRSRFEAEVTQRLHRLYPELRDVPIARSWTGPIDYSVTGLPYFGPADDRNRAVLAGVGYSGMGVVQTVLGGRILASLVREVDDEYSSLPLTRRWPDRLPPEPFRSLGAPVVKAALTRKERLTDQGRRPDPLTRFVAGLDPTTAPSQT
jgi:glycine/D-amino acid oxidase-like deaminating enzyme